jgi:endonuclease/exonuclease/phosphatase family metal-dependent hydrolase
MGTFRLATFNCENLFSRPRIFNEPPAKAKKLLAAVAALQKELSKEKFNQTKIRQLKAELKGYASVNDIRGKHTSANAGAATWLGSIELVRTRIGDLAIFHTAQVIHEVNADVLCLIEVENRITLQEFHDKVLVRDFAGQKPYRHVLLIDGNDERGIDVALFSRFPVQAMRTHIHETSTYQGKKVLTFSRDCLEADVELPSGDVLTVMINHLKSMGYSPASDPRSIKRRRGQAKRVAELVDERDPKSQLIAVCGDLNTPPNDATNTSLAPLLKHAHLENVNQRLPEGERGTYKAKRDNAQLDYLLVSKPLSEALVEVGIERRGCYTKTMWEMFDTLKAPSSAASDHCAVWVDFAI